jgi:rubredoxin
MRSSSQQQETKPIVNALQTTKGETMSANNSDIAAGKSEMLPEEILCPDCGASLKLSQKERTEKKFACPVCKETFLVKE